MLIIPEIFSQFSEVVAGQSTREGGVSPMPYGLNLSSHVGDDRENVLENRRRFYEALGIPKDARHVYQNQIHSANVRVVSGDEGMVKDSDALITTEPGVFLNISVADCTPVMLYDPVRKIIGDVHAGWRGTEQMIALKTIRQMTTLGSNPQDIVAFIGASASCERYEVGFDVATLFEKHHIRELGNGKFLLDVKEANREQLIRAGIPETQIEVSPLCSISNERLHSFRRDGKQSGRMFSTIGMLR